MPTTAPVMPTTAPVMPTTAPVVPTTAPVIPAAARPPVVPAAGRPSVVPAAAPVEPINPFGRNSFEGNSHASTVGPCLSWCGMGQGITQQHAADHRLRPLAQTAQKFTPLLLGWFLFKRIGYRFTSLLAILVSQFGPPLTGFLEALLAWEPLISRFPSQVRHRLPAVAPHRRSGRKSARSECASHSFLFSASRKHS